MNDIRKMRPRRGIAIAAMMGLGLLAGVGARATAAEVDVGAAKVDITPEGPIRLSGYLVRTTESVGVAHPIHAAALAIGSDEQKPAVVITVDNVGISTAIADEVAARLERKAGLTRDRLAIGVSHSHTAPVLTDVIPNIFGQPLPADQQERVDAYTREFTDKLERVALAALANRKPAELSWAVGEVGFAANRRTPGGPVDHSLSVLKATSPDGKIRAILTNYACHCTSIDPEINMIDGDWAGAAQKAIEEANPGCVALTIVGCGADSNPHPRRAPELAQAHGRALADEVARLLKGDWKPVSGPPATAFERIELPFDTLPTRDELEALAEKGGPPGRNAEIQLERLDRDGKLAESLPYSVQAWRFGDDLLWVFLPGEVVVDYALRLKKEFDPDRIIISAYSNDVPAYIPSERILKEGGYEGGGAMVYYAHPTRLKPGVEQIIIDAVHRVVGPHFQPPAETNDQAEKAEEKAAATVNDDENPPALSPGESLKTFRTKPGLKLELVASEPLIESPIAIDFAADGRLWVCEMRDYPAGMDGKYKPGGVVKVLEDRDGDGKYDAAVTFLEGLAFPTGVMAWREGVLITAAPEILYAEDTDGDGKADVVKTLYQGFSTENYQARVNGLSYNQDGWVYGANGLIGGSIRGRADGREVNIGGRDFRFKPDLGIFEPATGLTQQGRVHDDWGRQFGGNNSVLLQQYPLPDHYVQRNLRVVAPSPTVNSSRDPDPGRLYPISRTLARYNEPEQANRVTSACGPEIYRDSLLGAEYAGNGFACGPVHNLVRRIVLNSDAVVLEGRRAEDEQTSEFLASTDSWSRPVQVRTGPDGALWIVDMYRFVIEHPRWISPDRLATLDVRAGADMGRIYRLVPEDKPLRAVPNLETMTTPELAAALDSPNGVVRDMAQRLLDHRADKAAAPALAKIVRESEHPAARAQALSALDVLGALDDASILHGLADAHPGVRGQAVRVSEPRLAENAEIGRAVLALASDPEITVRYQTALSLGEWSDRRAGIALGEIAQRDADDEWIRAAVLSSASPHALMILGRLGVSGRGGVDPPAKYVEPLVATIAGSQNREEIAKALTVIADSPRSPKLWRMGAIAQLLDTARDDSLVDDPAVRRYITTARDLVAHSTSPSSFRVAALRLLGRSEQSRDDDREAVAERLDPAEPTEVQAAALKALERIGDEESAEAILKRWSGLGPALRAAALDALAAREELASALIAAIEAGRVEPSQIGAEHRERLLKSGPEALRQRAEAAFGSLKIGARRDVLDAFASVKTIQGDAARGKVVFERVCATCHKVGDTGIEVGPDLAALTDLSADALLTAILDPNEEIDARYVSYNAALKDGRVLSGMISGETASAITLKRQEGVVDVILRDDLDELVSSGRSLMPEGLENDLNPAEMADLIAFLSQGPSRPKSFPGNAPEVVKAGPGGVIRLTAANAQIYGPSLLFEPEFGNLGYWHNQADRAVWTLQVNYGSTFTVAIDWSCDGASAGNRYLLTIGNRQYKGTVPSTGGWANYQIDNIAFQALHPATHRLELRSDGPIRGALADVRAIILTPGESGPAPAVNATQAPTNDDAPKASESADDAARTILDPETPNAEREAAIGRFAGKSAELIAAMVKGLPPGDEEEEYRRIPWIWRVAIAAGRRDDADEMRRILEVSLPDNEPDAKLEDWESVVIGGGLINGVSMTGPLPGARFDEILKDSPDLKARWDKSIELAAKMADDESVRTGTRYDALRMLGVKDWEEHGEHLVRYLAEGIDPELHQGAVCALVDIPSPRIVEPLLESMERLTPSNRKFAIEGLARDADRREDLIDALEAGRIDPKDVGEDVRRVLVDPDQTRSAERAKKLFAE